MMPVEKNIGHYRQATTVFSVVFVNPILIMGFVNGASLILKWDKILLIVRGVAIVY